MLKRSVCLVVIFIAFSGAAFADFKYTEEHITKMNSPMGMMPGMQGSPGMQGGDMPFNIPGMPAGIMSNMRQQMQNPPPDIKTTYIKGPRKRVDNKMRNTSTITMCDKKQIVNLDHNRRTYRVRSLDYKVKEMEQMCGQMQQQNQEFTTEIPKHPIMNQNQKNNGQLVYKTTITDTGQVEQIGSLKAKHYIKDFEIYGNPRCMPDMKMKEHIWAANFRPEDFQCPVITKFKGCPELPNFNKRRGQPDMSCMKNAKFIQQGLRSIPGFVVKKEMEIDMGQMMGGMGGPGMNMPPMARGNGFKVKEITIIKDISKNPLPDSLFELPQGYVLSSSSGQNRFDTDPRR